MLLLLLSCFLAGILGFAAHRASVCTVRAVAELTHARTGYMLASIGKSALWVFAITLPALFLSQQAGMGVKAWQLTAMALLGGLMFGIGAAINGGCAYSTMARLVDGEIRMLFTIIGFAFGIAVFVVMIKLNWIARPTAAPTLIGYAINWAFVVGIVIVAWAVYEGARLWRTRPRGTSLRELILAPQYRLSSAAMLIGIASGVIFLLFGSPGYTTTLQQLVEGSLGTNPWPPAGRWFLLLAVLAGMALSTFHRRSFRVDWRPRRSWLRNIGGGVLMGLGTGSLPGGNDALILYGIPSLSPHALPGYLAMIAGIFAALMVMRRAFGMQMRVVCRNDLFSIDMRAVEKTPAIRK